MYNKCNTDMNKYTVIQTIRFSEKQAGLENDKRKKRAGKNPVLKQL